MKQFKIIDIISLFIQENHNYINSKENNYKYYLNVKQNKKSKKLTKPSKKRTISHNKDIQVIQSSVHKSLKYPKIKNKNKNKKIKKYGKKDKVLTSYPIVQYKPNYVSNTSQTPPQTSKSKNIKILSNTRSNGI